MAKRILITDDALFMRVSLKNILTQAGYDVVGEAGNGQEAVKMYTALQPDLVTMDITMPEMDGIAACKAIKAMNPAARIIMCSAMGQKQMIFDAVSAGAKDFIVKPFQAEKVIASVKKQIG